MFEDIAKITGNKPHSLGDSCTGFDASGTPNYLSDPTCTGLEGLIVPGWDAYGDFSQDPLRPDLNPASNFDALGLWYLPVIQPGDLTGALCIDPLTQTDCDGAVFPQYTASIWENMLNHVIRVMGDGNVHRLPYELQDVRYYLRWFGVAYVKYLKAYGNYPAMYRDSFPNGTPGQGLGPSDVMTQPIDRESLFFDYLFQPGAGGGQTFDKFEYVDRDFIGQGAGGTDCQAGFPESNCVPWDFEYGTDILGGNQRYDNWYRRMDREEIALYSSMLEDKTHTPGQENNVNITNLAGSSLLAGNWPSWMCATGQYTDPGQSGGNECGGVNPPLDPDQANTTGSCPAGQTLAYAQSWENGTLAFCGPACDYTANAATGCASPAQACVTDLAGNGEICAPMKMDRNGPTPCIDAMGNPVTCPAPSVVKPHPLLWRYPGAWGDTAFNLGHSPIVLHPNEEQPGIGAAKIHIPNFAAGPYTQSPIDPTLDANNNPTCPMGYSLSSNKVWCNAAENTGTGTMAPEFVTLTPWQRVGGGDLQNGGPVGFSIPEDGNRDQFLTTGQIDFTGVLESYVVDYVRWNDPLQPSCVSTGKCNPGYTCNPNSNLCVTDDDTLRIEAIEGSDFLGQVFMCTDPMTNDVLHMGMYDSATAFLNWLASHPGGVNPNLGPVPSAQSSCNIIIRTSPYDNAVDRAASLSTGVNVNFSGGQGQGRVTDVIVFDTNLIQNF